MAQGCLISGNVIVRAGTQQVMIAGELLSPEPKVFQLLLYLMQNAGRIVEKSELLDAVWKDELVCESALTRCVCCIRKLLSDDARTPTFVRTVHGRGYEFLAPCMNEWKRPRRLAATCGHPISSGA